jgi:hypothetical protein
VIYMFVGYIHNECDIPKLYIFIVCADSWQFSNTAEARTGTARRLERNIFTSLGLIAPRRNVASQHPVAVGIKI